MSNQYNNGQESFNEIGCEQNVTDQSRDCSNVKELPVTSKSEVVSKPADLLDISSETNVSNKSDDVVCIDLEPVTNKTETIREPVDLLEISSETNVVNKSGDVVCIDLEPVTNKSEAMRKSVDFLEISLETNVSFDSEDAPCSKELESTNESKSSNSDTKKKVVVGSHINSTTNDEEKSNHSLEYFVSCDPKENEDNNNPEWELLRKLQTDEERYKAVRMRWKNLVIPNPNQNLSYRFGGFKQSVNCNARKSHKRTHSATEIGNFNEPKRARTMSCTALFDQKVQERHISMNQTIRRIENNAQQAVNDLNSRETWCFTYRPHGSRAEEIYRQAMHIQNIVELRRKYEMQVIVAMKEGEEEINALRNAMEEVRVFNSFYQGLEPGLENTVFLTPSELEELVEKDKLYEDFNKFYK